jgi:hypothetical protein
LNAIKKCGIKIFMCRKHDISKQCVVVLGCVFLGIGCARVGPFDWEDSQPDLGGVVGEKNDTSNDLPLDPFQSKFSEAECCDPQQMGNKLVEILGENGVKVVQTYWRPSALRGEECFSALQIKEANLQIVDYAGNFQVASDDRYPAGYVLEGCSAARRKYAAQLFKCSTDRLGNVKKAIAVCIEIDLSE